MGIGAAIAPSLFFRKDNPPASLAIRFELAVAVLAGGAAGINIQSARAIFQYIVKTRASERLAGHDDWLPRRLQALGPAFPTGYKVFRKPALLLHRPVKGGPFAKASGINPMDGVADFKAREGDGGRH